MNATINIVGATIGLGLGAIYVVVAFRVHRAKPELSRIVILILSSVGFVTGLFLGYTSIWFDAQALGDLANHRIPILIGGVAIIYVSIDTTCGCYRRPVESETKPAANPTVLEPGSSPELTDTVSAEQ